MLSAVLGSVAAALAVLALDGVGAVALVTVVLLVFRQEDLSKKSIGN